MNLATLGSVNDGNSNRQFCSTFVPRFEHIQDLIALHLLLGFGSHVKVRGQIEIHFSKVLRPVNASMPFAFSSVMPCIVNRSYRLERNLKPIRV